MSTKRTAIITGVTGQDGSYLADTLLVKNYRVIGLKRRNSGNGLGCAEHLAKTIEWVEGDLGDLSSLIRLCELARADEFYNLAAQSHVGTSFKQPLYTAEASGVGVLNCLEAIRLSGLHTRFYQASTSEMFGGIHGEVRVDEDPKHFHPRSPYGCAKLFGYWATRNYRESYKMFASNGILFNHESPRRGPDFVTRKVVRAVAAASKGKLPEKGLRLGNLAAKRDWGHARDYVWGMWLILQHGYADDFVLATGETHTVQEFVEAAFAQVDLDWQQYVTIDPTLFRPAEVDVLIGDASKARRELDWRPVTTFHQLVEEMVEAEISRLEPA